MYVLGIKINDVKFNVNFEDTVCTQGTNLFT